MVITFHIDLETAHFYILRCFTDRILVKPPKSLRKSFQKWKWKFFSKTQTKHTRKKMTRGEEEGERGGKSFWNRLRKDIDWSPLLQDSLWIPSRRSRLRWFGDSIATLRAMSHISGESFNRPIGDATRKMAASTTITELGSNSIQSNANIPGNSIKQLPLLELFLSAARFIRHCLKHFVRILLFTASLLLGAEDWTCCKLHPTCQRATRLVDFVN